MSILQYESECWRKQQGCLKETVTFTQNQEKTSKIPLTPNEKEGLEKCTLNMSSED